jgi:L-ascorbate metabolism protein UlaG (beta-lactamase superfamily)
MSLSITFLGQSAFVLDDGQSPVVIDPFLTGNQIAQHTPDDIRCDYVALTHGHADHFGDTLDIAKKNDATVIGSFEICNYCNENGIEKVEPGNTGGRIQTSFGSVSFVQAFHSSSYQGQYMGMPLGLVFEMGGVTFYHCGDTGLFSDMKLIGEIYQPDIAAIPVGDRFTMDAKLGAKAAEFIGAKVAIPIHYKTFGLLAQTIEGFEPGGVEVKELAPGETWQYSG